MIHSIRSEPGNLQLINILKQRSTDEEVKRYAVAYMEGDGQLSILPGSIEGTGDEGEEDGQGVGCRSGRGRGSAADTIQDGSGIISDCCLRIAVKHVWTS